MRILTASDRALLVEAAHLEEAMRCNLAWRNLPGVTETVPGARTVLVHFDPLRVSAARLRELLAETSGAGASAAETREVTIPLRYDGEDLDEVAALLGVSPEEVIRRHLAARWRVAFSGFAPGFGYLIGDDPLFDVPRRSSPRTRVPGGSVALAGKFTGVYPRESPGGWQLIGSTDAVMWDVERDPPALLSPGASVRFVRAERAQVAAAGASAFEADSLPGADALECHRCPSQRARTDEADHLNSGGAGAGAAAGAGIEVLDAGLQLLVQDLGRAGHSALGVPASGAADRIALRDANRAVGNDPGATALENVGGARLRFHGHGVAAITGAISELSLTDAHGAERPIRHGAPFAVFDGDELRLGIPSQGLRHMIGVRGGILAREVLGSRSTDTLGGVGPAPLTAGDLLAVGTHAPSAVDPHAQARHLPASGDLVQLDVTLGPRADWFTPAAVHALAAQEWTVTAQADRVGIRLQGEAPLERAIPGELPSEGAVTGAIQVPADGKPVLFLPDHPVTGGYPIIGALTDGSLDLAGQLPPGARVRFRVVG